MNTKEYCGSNQPAGCCSNKKIIMLREADLKLVQKKLDLVCHKGIQALELSAGSGQFSLQLAPRVEHVTSLDVYESQIQHIRQQAVNSGIDNITLCAEDLTMHNEKGKFDLVVSPAVLQIYEYREIFFKQLSGMTKPHAHLIFVVPYASILRYGGDLLYNFSFTWKNRAFGKRQIRRLLAQADFEILDMKDTCLNTLITKGILLFVHAQKTI